MLHLLAAATIAATTLAATPGKVQWQADYGKALEATKSDQRPLLLVLDVPANPQASLDSQLLSTDGEQGKLLASYELCRVDASTEYGKKVAEAFHATQFPHTAIIDRTGKTLVFQKPGKIAADQWKVTLAAYQGGATPTAYTTFYRGANGAVMAQTLGETTQGYSCPLCQRKAMGF